MKNRKKIVHELNCNLNLLLFNEIRQNEFKIANIEI